MPLAYVELSSLQAVYGNIINSIEFDFLVLRQLNGTRAIYKYAFLLSWLKYFFSVTSNMRSKNCSRSRSFSEISIKRRKNSGRGELG